MNEWIKLRSAQLESKYNKLILDLWSPSISVDLGSCVLLAYSYDNAYFWFLLFWRLKCKARQLWKRMQYEFIKLYRRKLRKIRQIRQKVKVRNRTLLFFPDLGPAPSDPPHDEKWWADSEVEFPVPGVKSKGREAAKKVRLCWNLSCPPAEVSIANDWDCEAGVYL